MRSILAIHTGHLLDAHRATGLTYEAIADRSGISRARIASLIGHAKRLRLHPSTSEDHYRRHVEPSTAAALAAALEVDLTDLCTHYNGDPIIDTQAALA